MKFLSSNYDDTTGESIVTIADRYGVYSGKARIHPQDIQNKSHLIGCQIAEIRAWMKSVKNQIRRIKNQKKAIELLEKDITYFCGAMDPKIQKRFNIALKKYNKDLEEAKLNYSTLEYTMKKILDIHINFIKRGQNKTK